RSKRQTDILFSLIPLFLKKFLLNKTSKLLLKTIEWRFGSRKFHFVIFVKQVTLRKRTNFIFINKFVVFVNQFYSGNFIFCKKFFHLGDFGFSEHNKNLKMLFKFLLNYG